MDGGVVKIDSAGRRWYTNEFKNECAMRPDQEQGWWVAEMQLEPGEYRFRYLADGRWFTDFASHGVELKRHGWESVLVVGQSAVEARQSMAA